jgi:hypothetical protein
MDFEVVGDITGVETIASGSGIRERGRLRKRYGLGRWRKRKGVSPRSGSRQAKSFAPSYTGMRPPESVSAK